MKGFVSAFLWFYLMPFQLSRSANDVSLDEGRMLVSWTYDRAADKLSFQVNATAVGWLGFGFALSAPNSMQDYDVILTGYKDGEGYIYDMYSTGQSPPPLDSSQDYSLIMATEEEGHTILLIERAGNTGDAKDIQFTDNTEVFIVWSLHSSVDAINSSVYPFHERKGSSGTKYLIARRSVSPSLDVPSEISPEIMPPVILLGSASSVVNSCGTTSSDETAICKKSNAPKAVASAAHTPMNAELRSTPLSHLTVPTVVNPSKIPFKSDSGSKHPTNLNQESSKATQLSASTLSPFSSTDSAGLGSTSLTSATPFASPSNASNPVKQDNGFSQNTGKEKKNCACFNVFLLGVFLLAGALFAMGCSFRQTIVRYWKARTERNKIMRDIAGLPHDNPTECEGLIRRLNDQISALKDAEEKEKLLTELKTVAPLGLHEDLKQMMKAKGLQLEGLSLVRECLTDVPDLAKFLYLNLKKPKTLADDGLEIIRKRLGPDLEVLGGLRAAGIDVSKEWVKKLCGRAPSLQELPRLQWDALGDCCHEAEKGEKDVVFRLIGIAQYRQQSTIQEDENLLQANIETKAADKKNLKKAKKLLNEAKEMATDQSEESKKIIEDNLSVIMNILELPSSLYKLEDMELDQQLFHNLDQIIEQCVNDVEAAQCHKSELEIITKASAGRALCGIYHSEYEPPQAAGLRLLQVPTGVTSNPITAQENGFKRFSGDGLATKYVKKLTSSSSEIGSGVSGFYGLLAGDLEGGYEQRGQADNLVQISSHSASALHFIRTSKRTFQLEEDKIKSTLSYKALDRARSIVKDKTASAEEHENAARDFLKRYGSHYPAGVQTLGGVFFSITDVQSNKITKTNTLAEKAVKYLQSQMSAKCLGRPLGIGVSLKGGHISSKEKVDERLIESNMFCFTYNEQSMGPQANSATFHKLLSYSSNWALIDRGSFDDYIPVWELIRDLGGDFEDAARVLEETWHKDEAKRREKSEARLKERKRVEQMKNARDELQRIKEKHLKSKHTDVTENYSPTNGTLRNTFKRIRKRRIAYDRAIEFIMRNPRHHFCEITCNVFGVFYNLKCWEASDDSPTTLCKSDGNPILFFSKMLFKWKNHVLGRG